jgi:excisionase family DNA binding protein
VFAYATKKETEMAKSGRRVRIFSALEVANICGVVNQTAINWIRNGHLKAFTTPGGQYRIYAKDLSAFLDKRGMGASGEVLQVMMENADWNTFLIVAEQSISDPLRNEIGRLFPEYIIVQAFDWFEAGRKTTEVKPGFVLLDEKLAGVDISKFIRTLKNDPFFGKPYILLLIDNQKTETGLHGGNVSAVESGRASADLILTKPLDLEKLEAAMRGFETQLDTATTA